MERIDEQMAIDEIVNDWIDQHAVCGWHLGESEPWHWSATLPLFVSVTATGKTAFEAVMKLKGMLLDRLSTRHTIAMQWLYSSLLPEDESNLDF